MTALRVAAAALLVAAALVALDLAVSVSWTAAVCGVADPWSGLPCHIALVRQAPV